MQHLSSDVNNTKPTNHNIGILILRLSIKAEIPAHVSHFVLATMVGTKKAGDKTRNVVKPKPSLATAAEPALGKSFPTSSSQHAVEPQSPPTTPSKGKHPDNMICLPLFKTNTRP